MLHNAARKSIMDFLQICNDEQKIHSTDTVLIVQCYVFARWCKKTLPHAGILKINYLFIYIYTYLKLYIIIIYIYCLQNTLSGFVFFTIVQERAIVISCILIGVWFMRWSATVSQANDGLVCWTDRLPARLFLHCNDVA